MDYNKIREREYGKKSSNKPIFILAAIAAVLLIAAVILGIRGCGKNNAQIPGTGSDAVRTEEPTSEPTVQVTAEPTPTSSPTPEPTAVPTPVPVSGRGTWEPIPDSVRARMEGVSMHSNNNIGYGDLAYLTIPHYDFNYNVVNGEMVVNRAVADDVLDIFEELFEIKYPIERMSLVDNYGGSDYESIEANNTSAFNYRMSTDGGSKLSNHALGRAIDINPQINPYVNSSGTGSHSNAREYWSRNYESWSSPVARAAYIGPEAQIYKIFIAHGWTWGGSWSSYRDYQHFEKK